MKSKKTSIAIFVILATLIITNPSRTDFGDYLGVENSRLSQEVFVSKRNNFFICSVYEYFANGKRGKYFAILGQFYLIGGVDFFLFAEED